MNQNPGIPTVITCNIFWIGLIAGMSLLETWINLRTDVSEKMVWLQFGQPKFIFLNKIEWLLVMISLVTLRIYHSLLKVKNIWLLSAISILLIQSIWLLPEMRERWLDHIHGYDLPASGVSKYFLMAEVLKIISLAVFSYSLFKPQK